MHAHVRIHKGVCVCVFVCVCVYVYISTDRSDLWSQVSTTMSQSLADGLDFGNRAKTLIVAVQEKSTATTVGHLLLTALSSGCPALVKVYTFSKVLPILIFVREKY